MRGFGVSKGLEDTELVLIHVDHGLFTMDGVSAFPGYDTDQIALGLRYHRNGQFDLIVYI
jgi:hypothetical protein